MLRVGSVTIRRCAFCGLLAADPLPDAQRLRDLYEHYDDDVLVVTPGDRAKGARSLEALARWRSPAHHEILDAIGRRRSPGRLLDLGCSFGAFLVAARERGWDVDGVDLSHGATDVATHIANVRVRRGSLLDVGVASGSVDAVTMLGVLEHVSDLRAALAETYRLLRPGGVIALEVPNATFNLLRGRVSRRFFYLGNHLFNFTRRSLVCLLEGAGFDAVHVWCGVGDRPGGRTFNALKAAWIVAARQLERGTRWSLGPALVALATKPDRR